MRLGTMYRTKLFGHLGVRATGRRVLDVGTYDGHWLSLQPGALRVGIDIDVAPRPGINAIRGDGLRLPFGDGSFDSVFAFEVIEHVDDPATFVRELARVTAPGGSVTLSTPNADLRIFPGFLTRWAHRRWGHYGKTGFTPDELRLLFRDAGVTSVDVRPLRTWTLLKLYLPLTLLARVLRPMSDRFCGAAALIDSRVGREGAGGYVLLKASVR